MKAPRQSFGFILVQMQKHVKVNKRECLCEFTGVLLRATVQAVGERSRLFFSRSVQHPSTRPLHAFARVPSSLRETMGPAENARLMQELGTKQLLLTDKLPKLVRVFKTLSQEVFDRHRARALGAKSGDVSNDVTMKFAAFADSTAVRLSDIAASYRAMQDDLHRSSSVRTCGEFQKSLGTSIHNTEKLLLSFLQSATNEQSLAQTAANASRRAEGKVPHATDNGWTEFVRMMAALTKESNLDNGVLNGIAKNLQTLIASLYGDFVLLESTRKLVFNVDDEGSIEPVRATLLKLYGGSAPASYPPAYRGRPNGQTLLHTRQAFFSFPDDREYPEHLLHRPRTSNFSESTAYAIARRFLMFVSDNDVAPLFSADAVQTSRE